MFKYVMVYNINMDVENNAGYRLFRRGRGEGDSRMFCKKCGTWLPEDVPTCLQCGAKNENFIRSPRDAERAPEVAPVDGGTDDGQDILTESKQGTEEKRLVVGISVLLACIIVLVILYVTGVVEIGSRKDIFLYSMLDYSHFLFFDSNGKTKEIEDIPNIYYIIDSPDGTKAVYIDPTEYTLYYIDSRLKPVKITDRVVKARFSLSGDYCAYLAVDDAGDCSLYKYDIKKGKSTKVASNVSYDFICVSPNGKAVACLENLVDLFDNGFYLYRDGKEGILVGRGGCLPVAVSDDGKSCFYIKRSDSTGDDNYIDALYYFDGKDSILISDHIDDHQVFTNRNVNELLYNKDSQTYLFSVEQGESQYVGPNWLTMMVSDTVTYISGGPSITCNLDTLKDAFYRDDNSIIWFGDDGLCSVDISVQGDDCAISEDGRTLLYLYDGYLYKLQKSSDSAQPELLCESLKAAGLVTSIDLSQIYLITEDHELYHYRDRGHVTKLANDLQYRSVAYNKVDSKIYFIENGILFSASKSDKKEQVAQDVQGIFNSNGLITYYTENALYFLTKRGAVKVYSSWD